jgi:hypothetical protein
LPPPNSKNRPEETPLPGTLFGVGVLAHADQLFAAML